MSTTRFSSFQNVSARMRQDQKSTDTVVERALSVISLSDNGFVFLVIFLCLVVFYTASHSFRISFERAAWVELAWAVSVPHFSLPSPSFPQWCLPVIQGSADPRLALCQLGVCQRYTPLHPFSQTLGSGMYTNTFWKDLTVQCKTAVGFNEDSRGSWLFHMLNKLLLLWNTFGEVYYCADIKC